MIEIQFQPWGRFHAAGGKGEIHSWLEKVAEASKSAFEAGMEGSPGGPGSAGRYPGIVSGALKGSIRTRVSGDRMEIGTNTGYSLYLRDGTGKMRPRKMSHDALQEGIAKVGRLQGWAEWVMG